MMTPRYWYNPSNCLTHLLWPLSFIFCGIVRLRRWCYQKGILKTVVFPVPIIVVGNITVGGTGKTPLVISLIEELINAGLTPAVVSRGYGVKRIKSPRLVNKTSEVSEVGDEPVLMAHHVDCPIVVCCDRSKAVRYLLDQYYCNVIVSDDGLQHYRLNRDVEIAVIDAKRGIGNGLCLPVGPLREPASRLQTVDFVVYNGSDRSRIKIDKAFTMELKPDGLVAVKDFCTKQACHHDCMQGRIVHAVAGIGNPGRFFETLWALGFTVIEHVFPDHHRFSAVDIHFESDQFPVIMTEKDAVKCRALATERHWFLKVTARLIPDFFEQVIRKSNDFQF